MKRRYRLLYRGIRNTYYCVDTETNKRESLKTDNADEAQRLVDVRNEASRQPAINLQIAQVYLKHSDPSLAARTWAEVMSQVVIGKKGATKERYDMAIKDSALDDLRNRKLLETTGDHFLAVLRAGTVSTNVYLRRFHNFAVGMHYLPWPVLPRLLWPTYEHRGKRAVTWDEHQRIIAREKNPEMNAFLRLLWHLGGSQTDVATLTSEDVNWPDRTVAFSRGKSGTPVVISFGTDAGEILKSLPATGPLFPRLAKLHEKHCAKLFAERIVTVQIEGISLHSYRYSWAERAKVVGMPERYAQQALGHTSKAFARAYSRKAIVKVPSLEELEGKILEMPKAVNQ